MLFSGQWSDISVMHVLWTLGLSHISVLNAILDCGNMSKVGSPVKVVHNKTEVFKSTGHYDVIENTVATQVFT